MDKLCFRHVDLRLSLSCRDTDSVLSDTKRVMRCSVATGVSARGTSALVLPSRLPSRLPAPRVRVHAAPASVVPLSKQAMESKVHRWFESLAADEHPIEDLATNEARLIDNTNQACYKGFAAMKHRMQVIKCQETIRMGGRRAWVHFSWEAAGRMPRLVQRHVQKSVIHAARQRSMGMGQKPMTPAQACIWQPASRLISLCSPYHFGMMRSTLQ